MKQKKQLAVLVVLLLTAGVIWFLYFDRDRPIVTADAGSAAQNYQLLSVENPQLHTDRLKRARETEYKSTGRNIFSAILPAPPQPPQPPPAPDTSGVSSDPPPPPPPPTLPLKFFGYGTVPNGSARRAFFTDGEEVHVVAEGELLLNHFRILKVGNASLEFEEVSSGRRGTAILEEQGAPPSP
jgi:hypothetical protein